MSALNTVNAYRPLASRGRAGAVSFAAAWPTSEAPLMVLAAQTLGTAAAVSAGALRTRTGRAGLALELASLAGMAGLATTARRATTILDAALVDALGDGYRDELPDSIRDEAPLSITEQTLPALGQRRRYRVSRGLPYANTGRRNRLDIWRRADLPADAAAPVLIQVHGGAWMIGEKEVQGEVLLTEMARRGWVCASISYRLSPHATWPDQIVDVKRAIAWTRENIAAQGGDPSFIAVTGGSAGGHLAALAALTADDAAFQPGFETADTSVQACVPLYGVYDVADLTGSGRREIVGIWERFVMKSSVAAEPAAFERASPIACVHPGAPPMFVLHGRNDTLVPVEQARRFVNRLRAVSRQPVAYAELPGTQHAFEVFRSVRGIHATRAIARFLDVVHARHTNRSGTPDAVSV